MGKARNYVVGSIVLIVVILIIILGIKNQGTVIVSFDTKGGTGVNKIRVKKGSEIILPITTKEGYNFVAWYRDDIKMKSKVKITEKTKFYAKWKKITGEETFTVSFDSKGGSFVSPLVIECGKELNLPVAPSKEGYYFVQWEDESQTPISSKAVLRCSNITLYARWEATNETKQKEKNYTCPYGCTLEENQCVMKIPALEECSKDSYPYKGQCLTITKKAFKKGEKGCPVEIINGEKVKGEYLLDGIYFCYYKEVKIADKDSCEKSTGPFGNYVWRELDQKCFTYRSADTTTCEKYSNYIFVKNPKIYSSVKGLSAGCYPLKETKKYCEKGFELSSDMCIKKIKAEEVK